jgi:hypothetical protein
MGSREVRLEVADDEVVRIVVSPGVWRWIPPHDQEAYIAIEVL